MYSHYLDVAIGLSYTFLAVSLLCSATREAIASLFQTRAKVLLDAVLTLLQEPAGRPRLRGIVRSILRLLRVKDSFGLSKLGDASLTAAVMQHPLITGLAQPGRMPSYIPSAIFARALVSTLTDKYGKQQTAAALLAAVGNEGLTRTLLAIMGEGPDDLAGLENAVRIWYESVMERVSGWYKRRSQAVLFCVGLFYACAMNIDAVELSQRLWHDEALAASMVQQSEAGVDKARADAAAAAAGARPAQDDASPTASGGAAQAGNQPAAQATPVATTQAQLAALGNQIREVKGLPIGWPSAPLDAAKHNGHGYTGALAIALLGWIITAFAASLGSPFWFDGIGKLLALRGSGAKPAGEGAAPGEAMRLPGKI